MIKHIRKALVSWNNTYPLLRNLQGGKIKCLSSQNTANCFLSFEIIWPQEQTSPGFFWAIPWAKSTSQCIQSYCAKEQEQRGPSRCLPEVKFRLWFETGAFTCQEQFPLLFIRLAARKALEVQMKKTARPWVVKVAQTQLDCKAFIWWWGGHKHKTVPRSALGLCKARVIPFTFQCKSEIWSSDLEPSSPATNQAPCVPMPLWSITSTAGSRTPGGFLGFHHLPCSPVVL